MNRSMVFLGAALLFAAAGSGQTPTRTPQTSSNMPANGWMKTPYDLSVRDDLAPGLRRLRDEYWDRRIGNFGVLTPDTITHSAGDSFRHPGGEPEVPDLRPDDAALIGTVSQYRTVMTPSRRAIYTDVTLDVEHVFKDAVGAHALSGERITVSVPGGTVRTTGGQIISFMTDPQTYFMQPGRTYLLILYYFADGDFYVGTPSWDLSDGSVKANSSQVRTKPAQGQSSIIGATKADLIRLLDERFSGKR